MWKSLWLTCTKSVFATTAKECEFGQRLARRRLDLDLTQAQSADEAGVGKRTVERIEAGGDLAFQFILVAFLLLLSLIIRIRIRLEHITLGIRDMVSIITLVMRESWRYIAPLTSDSIVGSQIDETFYRT